MSRRKTSKPAGADGHGPDSQPQTDQLSREEQRMLKMIEAYEQEHRKKEEAAAKRKAKAEAQKLKREAELLKASVAEAENKVEESLPQTDTIPSTIPSKGKTPQPQDKAKGRVQASTSPTDLVVSTGTTANDSQSSITVLPTHQQQQQQPQQQQQQQPATSRRKRQRDAQLEGIYMHPQLVKEHQDRLYAAKRTHYNHRTKGILPIQQHIIHLSTGMKYE